MNTATATGTTPRLVRQVIAALVIGLSAIVGLASPANALAEPVAPGSNVSPVVTDGSLPATTTSLGMATTVAIVIVALAAVAIVILATRFARHRRSAQPAGLHI